MRRLVPILLLAVPLLVIVSVSSEEPPVADCAEDYRVPLEPALWSAQGGRIAFFDDEGGYVRLGFDADARQIRFNRDAALRVRVSPFCRSGEHALALDAEIRFSHTLEEGAELNDIMLLGPESRYLAGTGVPVAREWRSIRIPLPRDAGDFHAIHFGMGAQWVREYEGERIDIDLRNVTLRRRRLLHPLPSESTTRAPRWLAPEHIDVEDDGRLVVAAGAPAFAVLELPGRVAGKVRVETPTGLTADVWLAEWRETEIKTGVTAERPIRLLPYRGEKLTPSPRAHRLWLRLHTASGRALEGAVKVRYPGGSVTRPVTAVDVKIPEGPTRFQMYYQMNENWTGYERHADFYADAGAHFRQLRDFGFTGIHIAEEPRLGISGGKVEVDLEGDGRYWQRWPNTLAEVLRAAEEAGLPDPPVWEGLRIFRRDDVWARLGNVCEPAVLPEARLRMLADAILPRWKKRTGIVPVLSVADEPGTRSADEVAAVARELKALRAGGYRTYLTTHARLHDSFHALGPLLDINVLHAEDVTAGASAWVRAQGGELWLYNGGSMNIGPPLTDRFFAGVYGWAAGAAGITQWVYTRPSNLADPLDLRTRLSDDAQFYALPGRGAEPAATPALMGLAAGISDRRVLDFAERRAAGNPQLKRFLTGLRDKLVLPREPDEYAFYRLRKGFDPARVRAELLLLLAGRLPGYDGDATGAVGARR